MHHVPRGHEIIFCHGHDVSIPSRHMWLHSGRYRTVISAVTRGASVHIQQQAPSKNLAALKFKFKATSNWNK